MTETGKHVIAVNFKAYPQVDGEGAVRLAQMCQQVSEETGALIAVCPPMVSLQAVARSVDIPVFSQSLDDRAPGSATGWVTAPMVKAAGAAGTLINHSAHRVPADAAGRIVSAAKQAGLMTCVCAADVREAAAMAALSPDYVAVEPPELIGGDISVTTADPAIVSGTVEAVADAGRGVRVLCGAGVKNGKDVSKAIELGADGVLIASGVVKAADWHAALSDLASGL